MVPNMQYAVQGSGTRLTNAILAHQQRSSREVMFQAKRKTGLGITVPSSARDVKASIQSCLLRARSAHLLTMIDPQALLCAFSRGHSRCCHYVRLSSFRQFALGVLAVGNEDIFERGTCLALNYEAPKPSFGELWVSRTLIC